VLAHRLGLRALDYTAMSHVLGADRPMGPFELGRRLGISSGSATELVDRLERADQLERRRDPRETPRRSAAWSSAMCWLHYAARCAIV